MAIILRVFVLRSKLDHIVVIYSFKSKLETI